MGFVNVLGLKLSSGTRSHHPGPIGVLGCFLGTRNLGPILESVPRFGVQGRRQGRNTLQMSLVFATAPDASQRKPRPFTGFEHTVKLFATYLPQRPWLASLGLVALTIAALFGIRNLRLDPSNAQLFLQQSEAYRVYQRFITRFGSDETILVAFR